MSEKTLTAAEKIREAERLERAADLLFSSLLAPSMTEDALREEARQLRIEARAEWAAR